MARIESSISNTKTFAHLQQEKEFIGHLGSYTDNSFSRRLVNKWKNQVLILSLGISG